MYYCDSCDWQDEEMPELFKKPELIAEAIYVSSEKDKIDADTRKTKQRVFDNMEALKKSGQKVSNIKELISLCINKNEEE